MQMTKKENLLISKQEIQSFQPKFFIAGKHGVPRNIISTRLRPKNKGKIVAIFSSGSIKLKRRNIKLENMMLCTRLSSSLQVVYGCNIKWHTSDWNRSSGESK